MYIDFQQNRVKTQVMTVLTSLFAKKIASCINLQLRIIIFKNRLFQTCIIVKRTSIFSKIGLVDQSKPCTQIYLQKIRITKNHAFRTCTTSSRTFRPILSSIGLLGNELPRKKIISTDGRTDGTTDGRTDGRTDVAHDNNR